MPETYSKEHWQKVLTGESAVVTKWINDKYANVYCNGINHVETLEVLRQELTDAGFVRCRSL